MSFFGFPMAANIDMIAPAPDHAGGTARTPTRATTRKTCYKAASGPKELVIVPDADHVDLYDDLKKIPFDRLEAFFKQRLA